MNTKRAQTEAELFVLLAVDPQDPSGGRTYVVDLIARRTAHRHKAAAILGNTLGEPDLHMAINGGAAKEERCHVRNVPAMVEALIERVSTGEFDSQLVGPTTNKKGKKTATVVQHPASKREQKVATRITK